jgi:hypothetical protein
VRVPGRTAPAGDLAGRLVRAEQRGFVGRSGERELFAAALSGQACAVLFLHGPGGIGKTALLRRLRADAAATGAHPVLLDCRTIQPSPAGFRAELARVLGLPGDADPLPELSALDRAVLLLDTFERCACLQGWLRTEFLPRLPEEALTVVAGREPPDTAWRTDVGWQELLRTVALRDLPPEDALLLLARRGVPAQLHDRVLAAAGGHPLALCLIAELVGGQVDAGVPDAGSPDVVRALLERFLDEVPSRRHRAALDVCAHARVTTESLLRAVLEDPRSEELFGWLRERSFVEDGAEGLYPHDLAREVLDADLRRRDPERYARMHRRLRAHLMRQMGAPGADPLRSWQDVMFLHRRNPGLARFLEWEVDTGVYEDAYTPEDRQAVLEMTAAAEGAQSAAVCAYWLDRQARGCRVYRRVGGGAPAGFALELRLAGAEATDVATDPAVAAVWAHAGTLSPLRPGEQVEVLRTFVVPGAYHRPSPVMDLVQARCAVGWTTPPTPALSYLVLADPVFWAPQMTYIDHHPAGAATVGGRTYTLFGHDWRAVPAGDWLLALGRRELATGPGVVDGPVPQRAVLTEAEFRAAVKESLRCWRRPAELAGNPLCRSRVVVESAAGGPPARALADLLVRAADTLALDPRDAKLHRVVATTFFHGVPTQEAAAERLGLPFSTYRRHLAAGVARVATWLWDRELHGTGQGPDTD